MPSMRGVGSFTFHFSQLTSFSLICPRKVRAKTPQWSGDIAEAFQPFADERLTILGHYGRCVTVA